MDVCQPCHAAPQNRVAGGWVAGAVQIATESGQPCQEAADGSLSCPILQRDKPLKQFDLCVGEHQLGRQFR